MPKSQIATQWACLPLMAALALAFSCLQLTTRGEEPGVAVIWWLYGLAVEPILFGTFALPLICSIAILRSRTAWTDALVSVVVEQPPPALRILPSRVDIEVIEAPTCRQADDPPNLRVQQNGYSLPLCAE